MASFLLLRQGTLKFVVACGLVVLQIYTHSYTQLWKVGFSDLDDSSLVPQDGLQENLA